MTSSRLLRAALAPLPLLLAGCAGGILTRSPDIERLTASDAVAALCRGKITSEALTQAYLEQAKAHADHNAFVTLDEAGALREARAADARRAAKAPCLPLQGLPIVVKDNIQVAGLPTTAGTPALKNFVPTADAPVVQRLREAGAVILGKTNMHELAFGISGYNPAFNTSRNVGVRNAYDVTKMAGGSSAGTAVAIGLRMAPAGLGTDTGGSVRIPCALNGCASLRPTVGRYPQRGLVPISHTRDTAGPMAITMGDVELLDRVITGAQPVKAADLRGVRLGINEYFLQNMDADTREAFEAAVAKLRTAGVEIVSIKMAQLAELNANVSFPVALYEAHDDLENYLREAGTGVTLPQLVAQIASPDVKATYENLVMPRMLPLPDGKLTPAAPAYQAAMSFNRPALVKLYAETFPAQHVDALVFPTVPKTALPANPDASSLANFLLFIQNTDPGSNAGVPGIQVPMGLGATTHLPIGLELDGPAGGDRRLIALGMAIEGVLGRVPPAH